MMNVVKISARLMPAVQIGEVWISVEPTNGSDHWGKTRWRYAIDGPTFEHTGDDLHGWGDAAEVLGTLLAFLEHAAERYAYTLRTGRSDGDDDLFPTDITEWAHLNSDEIGMVRWELEEGVAE